MDKVIIYYHKETDTMDIWFGDQGDEYICEEVGRRGYFKEKQGRKSNRHREAVCE